MGYVSRDTSPIRENDDGRSISRNVAHLNILVNDMINLLYNLIDISNLQIDLLITKLFLLITKFLLSSLNLFQHFKSRIIFEIEKYSEFFT